MSNFRLKLKKLLESSFNENKKIDIIYHKKLFKNNNKFDSKYMSNNTSNLFFPERNKTNNNSFISYINNYNTKEPEKISLYKKYKKYNSIFDKPKISIRKNIFDTYQIKEKNKKKHIFDNSFSSQMIIKNKRSSNSTSTNHLTIDSFFNKNKEKKITVNINNSKINYRNKKYLDFQITNFKKKKSSNHIGNKIIKKIEIIENENKEKKVKNLLINRSPIVFNNCLYKSSNYNYSYYISKSRNDSKNKQKDIKKNKNFLDLDDLRDIISSIKNKRCTIIKNKEFNSLNK
jgi:hypothetical protein